MDLMIGPRGRDLIKSFEELRLEAYDDGTGVFTIGWGHTKDVKPMDTCTLEQAERLFIEDLYEAEAGVVIHVKGPMSQAMRDALASFVFNLGAPRLAGSELLGHVNAGRHFEACRAFLNWTRAGGKPMRGLMRRRLAEAQLYAEDPWPVRLEGD